MNKLGIVILSFALCLGLSIPCFADQIQGFVESTNPSDRSILIKDPVSGIEKTVHVHPKILSEIKKGSVVKATLRAGSDEADTVEVLVTR